jgi:hypothetical protein
MPSSVIAGRLAAFAALAALLLVPGVSIADAPLPARNLLVELRVVDDGRSARSATDGSTTVSSAGRVDAAGGFSAQSAAQRGELLQRVQVLNGASAGVQLVLGRPMVDSEVLWTAWGAGVALRNAWLESVDALQVRPRWSGGAAPVQIDIAVQRSGPAADGSAAQLALTTSLQAPLGEWIEVAQIHGRSAALSPLTVASSARRRLLQLRVSLP